MKYINVFETSGQYNPDNLDKPQLALVKDVNKIYSLSETKPGPSIEMVDLELPSGIKWASCNIGATCGDTPESWYGNYYAWGETETKTNYIGTPEGAYKWGLIDYDSDPAQISLTKYNAVPEYGTVDNKTTLETSDDVATKLYGSGFRMPTAGINPDTEEYTGDYGELLNPANTTIDYYFERPEDYEGDIDYKGNYSNVPGLYGILIKSNRNGNSIFIPAAGGFVGSESYYQGENGGVWSASLYSDNPDIAFNLYFRSEEVGVDSGVRFFGIPVRPIQNSSAQ
ncbi:MAG: hypothetical protein [Wendovervirus sonii]|uniref:Fibrobacter succinogenes major paralogous domain-containing protein n=1 Tax=phage Lak_Megaphage_Sonny TaxID=3109229 RepID=A0ABZ0Z271_9CAUD|nr:MAG: hypothetical protein [phage Lak_Megaphage_Sonny]